MSPRAVDPPQSGPHAITTVAPSACVVSFDALGAVRNWTPQATALFGASRALVEGTQLSTLLPFFAAHEHEGWCRRADGSMFRALVATLGADEEGRATHAPDVRSLVVTDVTSRYLREDVSRGSDAKLRAVLDATLDGFFTIDARGRITSLNHAATLMFRVSAEALIDAHWNTVLEIGSSTLPSAGTLQEATGRRLDGTTFALECGFSVVDVGADPVVIVVMRDMTQHRRLERQVLDVTEQLQRQIGQDLHDGLGQLLTGTAFLAKGLQRSVATTDQPQVLRVVELINQAIGRVRSLARGLSPIHVEAQNLEEVLQHTVSESSELLGIQCELDMQDAIDSARPSTIAQLCLIVREAITNAVRHGQARHVIVRLSREGERSLLVIDDDGVGIGAIDKPLEGLGLRSMRYRAQVIGGTLDVSRTTYGTTVRCLWSE